VETLNFGEMGGEIHGERGEGKDGRRGEGGWKRSK